MARIQDIGLSGADEPSILGGWEGRVLLTHDASTITRHAYERVAAGKPMPGIFETSRGIPLCD
ncbi:MAG: hypothetical protein L0387_12770 [Acidobacteria bacterium]|nr:hypothetical protein [Acidobacteriota bacterium]MCI0722152.1 hypothetical protein [Acidobacteriota bacterium]